MTVVLKDKEQNNTREFDTRSEAEAQKAELVDLAGADPDDLVIEASENHSEPDGQEPTEVIDSGSPNPQPNSKHSGAEKPPTPTPNGGELPDDPSVADDPVDWLPSHFIDTIQGVPTVNRKGYAVIASKYNVAVESEPVTLPSETDFEYAEFRATATTADGESYNGFGSAHVDRQDGDDKHLLAELAETRAMKRATAWATGVGLTAVEEMKGEL